MAMNENYQLKRAISLPMVALYGLGTIIGAGIFVLIGEVAGISGIYAPFAFLLASIIAAFTALSYAELSSRFPKSAGEAVYLEQAFQRRWLSTGTGFAGIAIGTVSAATITNGSVGYIQVFIDLPAWSIVLLLVTAMALLAAWGISESVGVAALTTTITITGLIAVIALNADHLATLPERLPEMIPPDLQAWHLVVFGAFVAFYAFIGFEDMINIAEEVKEPERNMPRSIILALLISALLYALISLTAVLAIPVETLTASKAPLTALVGEGLPVTKAVIGVISILAIVDGILIQIIKTSRILYGMSEQRFIHPLFASVHPVSRTPLVATASVAGAVLILAIAFPLLTLAQITSLLTLVVFAAINLALWRLKRRLPARPKGEIDLPTWIPATGFLLCSLFVLAQLMKL